jgi:hypothetical protein
MMQAPKSAELFTKGHPMRCEAVPTSGPEFSEVVGGAMGLLPVLVSVAAPHRYPLRYREKCHTISC